MNIEQLRKDMEAGTQGDWDIHNGMSSRPLEVAGAYFAHFSNYSDAPPHRAANARRIARVPQLERIALAAAALIDDVRARYPGEELRCKYMIALDEALREAAK